MDRIGSRKLAFDAPSHCCQSPLFPRINGDKPLLKREGGIFRAYGTPWCGKEGWNVDTSVPLRAVFLLSRADQGQGNHVRKMTPAEAFPKLLYQTHLPEAAEARHRVLDLLRALAGGVEIYDLQSEPTAEGVRMAWDAVRPGGAMPQK